MPRKRAKVDSDRRTWVPDASESEVEVVVATLQREIKKLKKENADLRKQLRERPMLGDVTNAAAPSPEAVQATAASFKKSLVSMIKSQIVYKPSLKHGSTRITAEIPNLFLTEVEAILGPEVYQKASKGPKQVIVHLDEDECYYGWDFRKSLRYGAYLGLKDGLKLTYLRETRTLKASGLCTMNKSSICNTLFCNMSPMKICVEPSIEKKRGGTGSEGPGDGEGFGGEAASMDEGHKREVKRHHAENAGLNKGPLLEGPDATAVTNIQRLPEAILASAAAIHECLVTSVNAQIALKSQNEGESFNVAVEIPISSLKDFMAILGPEIFARATKGTKTCTVQLTEEEAVRWGLQPPLGSDGTMVFQDGLEITYVRGTKTLKVAGVCRAKQGRGHTLARGSS